MIHFENNKYTAVCIKCLKEQNLDQFFSKQIITPRKKMRLTCLTCKDRK
jgi:hypothetical protein